MSFTPPAILVNLFEGTKIAMFLSRKPISKNTILFYIFDYVARLMTTFPESHGSYTLNSKLYMLHKFGQLLLSFAP